ncbi:MAG TPA: zinc ribbon domain-containing protein [Ktedonobacteraceae bacterium]|nr:zinc ribbon domain-containing protein [Ktedonobacteraceae bacterium]
MNCTSCGSQLPPGAASCPVCGNPTPYNVSAPAGSYDPTVAASPYGTPPPPSSPTPPYGAPTAYGTPPYGAPANPSDPYGNQASNPYGASAYAPPPPPLVQQPAYTPGQFAPQGQATQQKPKSKLPLILGIVAGVLLLLCIGACAIFYEIGKNASNTATTGTTTATTNTTPASTSGTNSTPASSTTGPSGQTIVPAAAAIITNAETSSSIDSNYQPTNPTTTFTVGQPIYATFNLHLTQPGYAVAKWYIDNQFIQNSQILYAKDTSYTDGYFAEKYLKPTNNGAVELYWCTKSDCSDGQLAAVLTFTVTGSSSIQSPTLVTRVMDMDRRI